MKNCLNEELERIIMKIQKKNQKIFNLFLFQQIHKIQILEYKKKEIKPYNINKLIEKTFNCFEYSINLEIKKS